MFQQRPRPETPRTILQRPGRAAMFPLVGVLALLLGAVDPSFSLWCTHCVSLSSTSCTGSSLTCPSGSACGFTYTESGTQDITQRISVMSCVAEDKCDVSTSASFPYGVKLRMGTTCCHTDNCTPSMPALPPSSSQPNGLTCRSCISANSDWCYTDDTMQCTGDENMCLLQTTKVTGPISGATAFRGCASKILCDLGSQTQTQSQVGTTTTKFICTNGSMGLQKGLYSQLCAMSLCLFLLKLIF